MGVKHYDVIVIGGGGGYTAALYCAGQALGGSAGKAALSAGGWIATTDGLTIIPALRRH